MIINECVKDFRGRSFYMENELICGMIMFFFQTSLSGWVSLSINEGEAIFTQEKSEPLLLDLGEINDEFAYPMKTISQLSNYIGKKLLTYMNIKLKVWKMDALVHTLSVMLEGLVFWRKMDACPLLMAYMMVLKKKYFYMRLISLIANNTIT